MAELNIRVFKRIEAGKFSRAELFYDSTDPSIEGNESLNIFPVESIIAGAVEMGGQPFLIELNDYQNSETVNFLESLTGDLINTIKGFLFSDIVPEEDNWISRFIDFKIVSHRLKIYYQIPRGVVNSKLTLDILSIGFDGFVSHSEPEIINTIQALQAIRNDNSAQQEISLLRAEFDHVDNELIRLLMVRMEISGKLGGFKRNSGTAIIQPERMIALVDQWKTGLESGISARSAEEIAKLIHLESVKQQLRLNYLDTDLI